FCCGVLWPAPAQISDKEILKNIKHKIENKKNYKILNNLFSKKDTGCGDCSYQCFSRKGKYSQLLKPEIICRLRKPYKQEFPPITKVMNEQLSSDRNSIEKNFGFKLILKMILLMIVKMKLICL